MVIAGSFPEVLSFAARVGSRRPAAERPRRSNGRDRRETPDERLAAAMKANPGANIATLAAAIALDPPPFVGLIKPEGQDSGLGVVVVCEGCARAADGYEDLKELVADAVGGALAPAPTCH
jgi:hypothetical protein